MTILQHPTARAAQASPTHPLVDAVLTVADYRSNFTAADWDAVVEGFGSTLDSIAADLETADQYAEGMRDSVARTAEAAEAEARRLRDGARHDAAYLASNLIAGGMR